MKNWFGRLPVITRNGTEGEGQTFGARLADRLTQWAGSWPGLIWQLTIYLGWIAINWIGLAAFDRPPFIGLNLILSLQAAVFGCVILMSSNRQAERDREMVRKIKEIVTKDLAADTADLETDGRVVLLLEEIKAKLGA